MRIVFLLQSGSAGLYKKSYGPKSALAHSFEDTGHQPRWSSIGGYSREVDHERKVAIFDLLEENFFELVNGPGGPYKLTLAIVDKRLAFAVTAGDAREPAATFLLSLTPFRKSSRTIS